MSKPSSSRGSAISQQVCPAPSSFQPRDGQRQAIEDPQPEDRRRAGGTDRPEADLRRATYDVVLGHPAPGLSSQPSTSGAEGDLHEGTRRTCPSEDGARIYIPRQPRVVSHDRTYSLCSRPWVRTDGPAKRGKARLRSDLDKPGRPGVRLTEVRGAGRCTPGPER